MNNYKTTVPDGLRKLKVIYFYISHSFEGFQGFNIHIQEFMEHANQMKGIEIIGAYPLAKTIKHTAFYLRFYHKIKFIMPRFAKDLLALFSNLIDYRHAVKKIAEVKPDIILFRHNHLNFYQTLIKYKFKLPLLLEVNAPMTQERINLDEISLKKISFKLEKWSWRTADKIYVVSNALKNIIARHVPSDKIIVVHNGVNADHYKGLIKKKSDRIIIGFAGSFRKYHGIPFLFNIIPRIIEQYPQIDFHLIGGGGLYSYYKELCEKDPLLHERVFLPGHIKYTDLPNFLISFDIGILMDFTEYGSPLKLFEYMIARTCIIVPDRAPIREVVTENKEALFFKPHDESSFLNCLASAVSNPSLREMLANNAYLKVIENYTWAHNANKIVDTLKSLVPH